MYTHLDRHLPALLVVVEPVPTRIGLEPADNLGGCSVIRDRDLELFESALKLNEVLVVALEFKAAKIAGLEDAHHETEQRAARDTDKRS